MKGYEILELLITSSVLILGIAALRVLAGDRLSGRVRYALWLAVALRLLLPFLLLAVPSMGEGLRNGYGMMNVLGIEREKGAEHAVLRENPSETSETAAGSGRNAGSAGAGSQIWTEEPAGAADRAASPGQTGTAVSRTAAEEPDEGAGRAFSVSWPAAAAGLWAGGTVLLALWELFVNVSFYRKLKRSRKPFAQELVPVRVYVTPEVRVPCQYGRGIYLPKRLETEMEGAGLRHVLIHEYCHYCHGDFLWSLLRCVLLALYWPNPLVWLAAVLSKKDCELACDEAALKRLKRSERLDYGRTLVRLASGKEEAGGIFRAATSLAGSWGTVKERIWRVALRRKRFSGVVTVCTALLGIVLLAGCSFTGKVKELSPLIGALAKTEGAELWFNDDLESEDYGEMTLRTSDGKSYSLGRLEPLEEMEPLEKQPEGEEDFTAASGEIVPADYDGDGEEELAVTMWYIAQVGKNRRKQERLFVLEPEGDGWKAYEYTEDDYRQDWNKYLHFTDMDNIVNFDHEGSLNDHSLRNFALEEGEILSRAHLESLTDEKWVEGALDYKGDGKFLFDGAHYQETRVALRELRNPEEFSDKVAVPLPMEDAEPWGDAAPIEDEVSQEDEVQWFGKDERSYSTMLAETKGEELWYDDQADSENYGELAVLAGDGNYYVLGRLEEPEEMDIRDLSVSVSGEMRMADYDEDGTEELAVAVRRRANDGRKSYSDVTRLFVLEWMGDGWHPYEYRPEAYVEDWKALLPPEIRDEEGVRYDKAVGIYLRGDAISFHSYSASWDGEYGYTFPDGGVMSWLDVRVEYRNGGRFALSEPYAPEGQEGYLEDYRKMMEQ